MDKLQDWLRLATAQHASDLHLRCGQPPWLRRHGQMVRLDADPIEHQQLLEMLHAELEPRAWQRWREQGEVDCGLQFPLLGRVRLNAFRERQGPAAVLRLIPPEIPPLAQLAAPPLLAELACASHGLVLVCGPTGSGKSTTLAALLDCRNASQAGHILTIEDPIEFVHRSQRSLISQREIGTCTPDCAAALRAALRQDPDCLMLGELRDLDSIRIALSAAETGHLVLATLHTASAPQAIDRLIDVFPGGEKDLVRVLLSQALLAVVAQTLLPRADGRGRVAAFELMLATPAVRNLIREHKTAQLVSVLQTSAAAGMQTMAQSLQQLRQQGLIAA